MKALVALFVVRRYPGLWASWKVSGPAMDVPNRPVLTQVGSRVFRLVAAGDDHPVIGRRY